MKTMITNLCYSIIDIVNMDNINISAEHKQELKYIVDDALLWLHVTESITCDNYKSKIEEINTVCNEIIDKYQNELFVSEKSNKDELEELCLMIKLLIADGAINYDIQQIDAVLDWLSDETHDNIEKEKKEKKEEKEEKIQEKIVFLTQIYESRIDQDGAEKTNDVTGSYMTYGDDGKMGTNIINIVRDKQKEIIDNMINN
jgi:hypothetical protein